MTFNPYEEVDSYFVFHQRVVILNILKVARSQKKKTIEGTEVHQRYLRMCYEYDIEPVFRNNILYALKAFEVAGFIKIKPGMKITKLDLGEYTIDDWIQAIMLSPDFSKIKRQDTVRDAIQELAKSQKSVTRDQIKEASGINEPGDEIFKLVKSGIIMEVGHDDIRWV
jgi:Cdc6-like AAA superfamily ATPase